MWPGHHFLVNLDLKPCAPSSLLRQHTLPPSSCLGCNGLPSPCTLTPGCPWEFNWVTLPQENDREVFPSWISALITATLLPQVSPPSLLLKVYICLPIFDNRLSAPPGCKLPQGRDQGQGSFALRFPLRHHLLPSTQPRSWIILRYKVFE